MSKGILEYRLEQDHMGKITGKAVLVALMPEGNIVRATSYCDLTASAIAKEIGELVHVFGDFCTANYACAGSAVPQIYQDLQDEYTAASAKQAATEAMYAKEQREASADKVYEMLTSQSFVDWYEGEFMDHVEGEEGCQSDEEIKKTIADRFMR